MEPLFGFLIVVAKEIQVLDFHVNTDFWTFFVRRVGQHISFLFLRRPFSGRNNFPGLAFETGVLFDVAGRGRFFGCQVEKFIAEISMG